jgi:hypothetical protein
MAKPLSARVWRCAALAAAVSMAGPAFAVDGVVLIDQAKVNAAGGFPFRITQPGSYRLAGNLTVSNPNVSAIELVVTDVSIDLNGFAIVGPSQCGLEGSGFVCRNTGTGYGIVASLDNSENGPRGAISVSNGHIRGMGRQGIALSANAPILIRNVVSERNGSGGILAHGWSAILDSVQAFSNGGPGIAVSYGVLKNSVSSFNNGVGIIAYQSALVGNSASFNRGFGLAGSGQASGSDNLFMANSAGAIEPSPLTFLQTGKNVCGQQLCP